MAKQKPNHFDDWGLVHHTSDNERTLYIGACGALSNAPDDTVETAEAVTCLWCFRNDMNPRAAIKGSP